MGTPQQKWLYQAKAISRVAVALLSVGSASCGLFSRGQTRTQGPPAPAMPPRPAYVEQQTAGGGFMAPLRPPAPTRKATTGASMLLPPLGGAQAQGFFGNPFGTQPFPPLLWPWSMTVAPSMQLPLSLATPTPPPRAQHSAPQSGCGYVEIGARRIPVDCFTPGYANVLSATRPLLPNTTFRLSPAHAGAALLPPVVDHREEGTEGPVRNQDPVGACSAFSFASAVDHALASRTGRPGFVSAMHVWARYHEPSMSLPADRNINRPLTREEAWPYTPDNAMLACSWAAKNRCAPSCRSGEVCACERLPEQYCGREVDAAWLAYADAAPVARVTEVTVVERDRDSLLTVLAKGQDIWIAMNFTRDAYNPDRLLPVHDGLSFVMPHFDPEDIRASHAMVIAGYRVRPTGVYFLLHNSWGEEWGDHGYVWVHETTLMKNLLAAYVVDAEPWDPSKSRVPPRQENPSQCGGGLLPDSITGQCTPACPDGSARHNAVCPDLGDCPAGYVNLYGECVVAAPNVRGTDPDTRINYACAAGGCSFVVPFGVYGCFMPWCTASCPSPQFRLSYGGNGMSCTE